MLGLTSCNTSNIVYYIAILCHKLVLLVLVRLKILIMRLIAIKIFNRSAALVNNTFTTDQHCLSVEGRPPLCVHLVVLDDLDATNSIFDLEPDHHHHHHHHKLIIVMLCESPLRLSPKERLRRYSKHVPACRL